MAIAYAHLAPWAAESNLAVRVNRAIDDRPGIHKEAICYQWFKQRLILSVSKPRISQRSQIKEDTVEPSVPARESNLNAYATITWHNDRARLGFEPRLATYHSQAASVCPFVRDVPVSDENGLTYRHGFFHHTVAQLF